MRSRQPPDGDLPASLEKRFTIQRARSFRASLERCRASGGSCLELLFAERVEQQRGVAVLAGSFNPLTLAHLGLAEAAEAAGLGPVVFALSTQTVDKERLEGAVLEDRLLVLELVAERTPARAVALINRGLYVEQAELFRDRLPALERLVFLVGYDKIVQIFDSRYYEDREAALEQLFGLARFAVAPRGRAGQGQLAALLERPENRRFAGSVQHLDIPADLAEMSSSAARAALARGEVPDYLAAESAALCRATGCYLPPAGRPDGRQVDRYAERRRALEGD
jgi:nicotinic acid mononucleotide adenylyltransferase